MQEFDELIPEAEAVLEENVEGDSNSTNNASEIPEVGNKTIHKMNFRKQVLFINNSLNPLF